MNTYIVHKYNTQRKFYDKQTKRYVTLEQLSELFARYGKELKVLQLVTTSPTTLIDVTPTVFVQAYAKELKKLIGKQPQITEDLLEILTVVRQLNRVLEAND